MSRGTRDCPARRVRSLELPPEQPKWRCRSGCPLHDSSDGYVSARTLIPRSIFRSMSSEAGSIGIMPIRAPSVGSRKRLRLIRRVEPPCSVRTNVQTQLPF